MKGESNDDDSDEKEKDEKSSERKGNTIYIVNNVDNH